MDMQTGFKTTTMNILWITSIGLFCFFAYGIHADAATQICADGWTKLVDEGPGSGLLCAKLYNEPLSWTEASNICRSEHGSLLILDEKYISSAGLNESALHRLQSWIENQGVSEIWTALHLSGHRLWWDAMRPIAFSQDENQFWKWSSELPDVTNNKECSKARLQMSGSPLELTMTQCSRRLPFVCVNQGLNTDIQQGTECEEGWSSNPNSDHCLWTSPNTLTFTEAEHMCESMDSHLVVADTASKQQFLLRYIEELSTGDTQLAATSQKEPTASSSGLRSNESPEDPPSAGNVMPGMLDNELEDDASGLPDSTGNGNDVIAIWIGLKVKDGQPFWINEAAFDPDLSHFVATNWMDRSGCVMMSADHTGTYDMVWLVAQCTQRFRAVCEKEKILKEAPQIIVSPSDITTISRLVPRSNIEPSTVAWKPYLTCNVTGYIYEDQPIIWLKDGSYIDNGLPRHGLTLNISMDINEQLAPTPIEALQGHYQCQIWDAVNKRMLVSKKAKLVFQDVLIYKGSLTLPNSDTLAHLKYSLLTGTLDHYVALLSDMLMSLFALSFRGDTVFESVVQLNYVREDILYFTLYYTLPSLSPEEWTSVLDILQLRFYRDMPGETMENFIDRMEAAFLRAIQQQIENAKHDRTFMNNWHLANGAKDENRFRSEFLEIWSTVACPARIVRKDGIYFEFDRTSPGATAHSKQVCLSDGVPHAKSACLGDSDSGLFWGDITWKNSQCSPPALKSVVSDDMFRLSQDKSSSSIDVARQLERLSRRPEVLVYPDITCASHVIMDLARSYMSSVQTAGKIVSTANLLMQSRPESLEMAEFTNNATTRILKALETLSSQLNVEGSSMIKLCEPYICLQVHDAEIPQNERNLGRGIRANTNDVNGDQMSPENVEMVPQDDETMATLPVYSDERASASFESASGAGPVSSNIDAAFFLPDEVMNMMTNSDDVLQYDDYHVMDVPPEYSDYPSDTFSSDPRSGPENPDAKRSGPDDSDSYWTDLEEILGLYLNHRMSRVTFSVYFKHSLFIGKDSKMNETEVNSRVVASTVNGYRLIGLEQPVLSVFKMIQNVSWERHTCVWWDFTAMQGSGGWSTEGCWLDHIEDERIFCACNHLTNFAVLVDTRQDKTSDDHELALSIISILGITVSLVGLTLTVLTFALFKKMRQYRSQKVLLNLAIALMCLNIVFLAGITQARTWTTSCFVVAALIHYFLLASFGWMLVEGVLQYLKFVKVLDTYIERFMLKSTLPAWGLPLLIVVSSIFIDYEQYRGSPDYCWVSLPVLYFAVLLPIGVIIVINSVLFTLVIKGLTCDRPHGLTSNQSQDALVWLRLKAVISCFVLLGVTWFFGFLAINDARLPFQYIFCICNSLQGFFIFLCHVLREKTSRALWYNLLCCCRKQKPSLGYRSTMTSRLTRLSSSESNKSQKSQNSKQSTNTITNKEVTVKT